MAWSCGGECAAWHGRRVKPVCVHVSFARAAQYPVMSCRAMSPANAFIARFLARVPREVAASFTPAQLQAVQRAFGMRYVMEHAVDLRRTWRLPWDLYLVLLAGRDQWP